MPTLFADFPLIGSESFVYPCIINSHHFWPNEERSNIALREGSRAASNKRLMIESMILLKNFIVEAISLNFKGIHNLICIQTPDGSD